MSNQEEKTYLAGDQPHRCDECGQCLHYGCKCCSECRYIRDENLRHDETSEVLPDATLKSV